MTPERDRQLERTREVLAAKEEEAQIKADKGQLAGADEEDERAESPGDGTTANEPVEPIDRLRSREES